MVAMEILFLMCFELCRGVTSTNCNPLFDVGSSSLRFKMRFHKVLHLISATYNDSSLIFLASNNIALATLSLGNSWNDTKISSHPSVGTPIKTR